MGPEGSGSKHLTIASPPFGRSKDRPPFFLLDAGCRVAFEQRTRTRNAHVYLEKGR